MKKLLSLCLVISTAIFSCQKDKPNISNSNTTKTTTETISTLNPTVFAGNGTSGSVDGTGASAQFYQIIRLTSDKAGNIYVLEAANTTANLFYKIRKVTPSGVTSTLFNGGAETFLNNIPIEKTKVYNISDIAADANGNLYVLAYLTDYSTTPGVGQTYYQEMGTYKLNTSTGGLDKISVSSSTLSTGIVSWSATYNLLNNLTTDASGNIYGAYSPGNTTGIPSGGKIYKVVTGSGSLYAAADAIYPSTLVGDAAGVVYASTTTAILKVTTTGANTYFTFPTATTAVAPRLIGAQSGILYAYGDLYDSSNVYKGTGFYKVNIDGSIGSKGILINPTNLFGVVTDSSGNIYYALHLSTGGYVIYKVTLN